VLVAGAPQQIQRLLLDGDEVGGAHLRNTFVQPSVRLFSTAQDSAQERLAMPFVLPSMATTPSGNPVHSPDCPGQDQIWHSITTQHMLDYSVASIYVGKQHAHAQYTTHRAAATPDATTPPCFAHHAPCQIAYTPPTTD